MGSPVRWSSLTRPVQVMLRQLRDASPEQCEALAAGFRARGELSPDSLDGEAVTALDAMVRDRLDPDDGGTDVHQAALSAVTAVHSQSELGEVAYAEHTAAWVAVFGEIPRPLIRLDWLEVD